MLTTITIILVIGGLIFFHELGHFLVARIFGVGVSKFSLGLGPRLFGMTWGKTHYQLAAIPLGGYVMLVGEQDGEELPENFTVEESFSAHPSWQKLLIVVAGPMFNLFLAWMIAWGLFWNEGEVLILPEIGTVQPGTPAEKAGLIPGDIILQVDGEPLDSWEKLTPIIYNSKGVPLDFEISRQTNFGTEIINLDIAAEKRNMDSMIGRKFNSWVIGISPPAELTLQENDFTFFESGIMGAEKVWMYIAAIGQFLKDALSLNVEVDSLVGPIGMGQLISVSAEQGLSSVLQMAMLISINLGILNLLPIPMLDGGHIVFFMIEMATGRKIPDKIKEIALRLGLLLLLCLMGLAIGNDVIALIRG